MRLSKKGWGEAFRSAVSSGGIGYNREIAELLEMEKAHMQRVAERDWLRTELAVLHAVAAAIADYVTADDPRAAT